MATSPPSIAALPTAPDPNDRTTFNARAYPWSAALNTLGTEANALASNVYNNALDAATQATTATAQAVIATAKAVLTTDDAAATAADRVQTGLDRAAVDLIAATAGVASVNGSTGIVTGIVDLTTAQTLTNKTITETVYALSGTTPALTATNGSVQTWTLSANSTPTNSLTSGQSIILVITPGAFTVTWPSVTWSKVGGSGAAPTLFSAGKTTVVLWMVGSVLYGSHLGDTA